MKKTFPLRRVLTALMFILALLLVSCDENLFVKAEPTPEGRAVVDSVYDSIVGVEEKTLIEKKPFWKFTADSILRDKVYPDATAEADRAKDEDMLRQILIAVFGEEAANENMPGLTLTLLEGFSIGDFDRLAGLHTKADIAYMNERLGSLCKPGETYTEVLETYYTFIKGFTEGDMKGVINIEDRKAAELKIADVVTVRLATRFLFNTLVTAIYNDFSESGTTVEEYIATLSTETIVYILTQKNVFEDITNTYTILNKLKGSTTIVDIGFLEAN